MLGAWIEPQAEIGAEQGEIAVGAALKDRRLVSSHPVHAGQLLKSRGCFRMQLIRLSLVVLLASSPLSFLQAGERPLPSWFEPEGERVEVAQTGLAASFMHGEANGPFFIEFIEPGEPIDNWRGLYLVVQRRAYPDSPAFEEARRHRTTVPDVAVGIGLELSREGCRGDFRQMEAKHGTIHGLQTAFAGYYCSSYGEAVPHGEGRLFRYILGSDYLFEIAFGWRPRDASEVPPSPAYGIPPGTCQPVDADVAVHESMRGQQITAVRIVEEHARSLDRYVATARPWLEGVAPDLSRRKEHRCRGKTGQGMDSGQLSRCTDRIL